MRFCQIQDFDLLINWNFSHTLKDLMNNLKWQNCWPGYSLDYISSFMLASDLERFCCELQQSSEFQKRCFVLVILHRKRC